MRWLGLLILLVSVPPAEADPGTGTVEVVLQEGGFTIAVDGEPRATTTTVSASTYVRVPPGEHTISVVREGHRSFDRVVDVESDGTLSVFPVAWADLGELPPAVPWSELERHSVFWTGVAGAVAGLAVLGYGIQASSVVPSHLCADTAFGTQCGPFEFAAFGYPTELEAGADPNPGSVYIAPLGYSLLLGGGALSLGSLLFGEEGEVDSWLVVGAGLTLGLVSYGISVVAGGKDELRPFEPERTRRIRVR